MANLTFIFILFLTYNMNKTWPIFFKIKIDSSLEDLWMLFAKPRNLNLVHPFCKSNEIINWGGLGSIDMLVHLNGLTYLI